MKKFNIKGLKVNKKAAKEIAALTITGIALSTPTFASAAAGIPIVDAFNNILTEAREALIYVIPSAAGVYMAWHSLNSLGGDSHKKAETKEKMKSGLMWGAIGTSAAAVVNFFYGFF